MSVLPVAEISDPKNDYNLNLPRYIDSTEPEDLQDIEAHLKGGIPNRDIDGLDAYWAVFPDVRRHDQAIDHQINLMLLVAIQLHVFFQAENFTVHPNSGKARLAQPVE
jgi:hypothetical protein